MRDLKGYRCVDCRQHYRAYAPIDTCPQCGGTVREDGTHPLAGRLWAEAPTINITEPIELLQDGEQLTVFAEATGQVRQKLRGFDERQGIRYNEGVAQEDVTDLLAGIDQYLAAHIEMDRYTNEEA